MNVIGINDSHDASVCLIRDGTTAFAIQEERLNRVKGYCGFPYLSLDLTLRSNELDINDIDLFAFCFEHSPPIIEKSGVLHWYRSLDKTFRGTVQIPLIEGFRQSPGFRLYRAYSLNERMRRVRKAGIPKHKAKFINHHTAHAASAYYGSPYDKAREQVLVLTLDGGGDDLCGTVFIGENGRLRKISEVKEGNSIGNIYSHVTCMLGMTPLEHEYKLMGLAPYAKPEYFRSAYEKLNGLLRVDGLSFKRSRGPSTLYSYRVLTDSLKFERFDNICGALQLVTEEIVLEWIRNCITETSIGKLACSGGVFMNVKLNKRIIELPECESLFVFPSCGDESAAVGAAYEGYARSQLELGITPKLPGIEAMYLGPAYSESTVVETLRRYRENRGIHFENVGEIDATLVQLLEKDRIVARFEERSEFGARALGNRSILANPSHVSNIRKINDMIKMRDFWMPFAPSILSEHESDYIVNPKRVRAPYMILSFDTTERRDEIGAAIHPADFTVRPQVVFKEHNPKYWSALDHFSKATGIGGVLNTSFNLHGEPIVQSPDDALSTFVRSGLEYLALGDYLVWKS